MGVHGVRVTGSSELQDHSDEELMAGVAGGDAVAFAALHGRFAPAVLHWVVRTLVDSAQAEEVAQEVFLHAWRHASQFDPARGRAAAWLKTLAHRRAIDRVRSSQSSTRRDEETGRRDFSAPFDSTAETVEASVMRDHLERALSLLTDVQQEALRLRYHRDHSNAEIAERLAIPIGTVKTRIRDGLQNLRRHVDHTIRAA